MARKPKRNPNHVSKDRIQIIERTETVVVPNRYNKKGELIVPSHSFERKLKPKVIHHDDVSIKSFEDEYLKYQNNEL